MHGALVSGQVQKRENALPSQRLAVAQKGREKSNKQEDVKRFQARDGQFSAKKRQFSKTSVEE
jgi:hypothetical protein